MPEPREVVVFPGPGKSGTTALQETLRRSRDGLRQAGWQYLHDPNQETGEPLGSGNGNRLYRALVGGIDLDPVAEFERLAPAGSRSIIACEGLTKLRPHHWRPLLDLLSAEGGSISAVYCFRDLYPYIWSSYNQRVSLQLETGGFGVEWIFAMEKKPPHDQLFDQYLDRIPDSPGVKTSRTVLHYETIRSDAVRQMLQAAKLPVEVCDLDAGRYRRSPINRSHTQPELALLRRINAKVDPYRAWWSGKTLAERPLARKVRPVYVPEVHEWLEQNHLDHVARFNDSLPPGTEWALKIFDESAYEFEELDPQADQSPEYAEAIYYLLSFDPAEDYRDYLISLLPGGVYDPPSPPSRLRRAAGKLKGSIVRS